MCSPWPCTRMASGLSLRATSRRFAGGRSTATSRRPAAAGIPGPVHQLAFSGDGQRLISASGDRTVRLWNGKTGEPIRQLPGAGDWMYAVAISDDGGLAAAGGWDGLVRLWDAGSGPPAGHACSSLPAAPKARTHRCPVDWFAITPGGQVAGSPDLIGIAEWRAGGSQPSQRDRPSRLPPPRPGRPGPARRARQGCVVPVQEVRELSPCARLCACLADLGCASCILAGDLSAAWRRHGAQTSYPMTLRVDPVAVTRGHTVEITVSGARISTEPGRCSAKSPGCAGGAIRQGRGRRAEGPPRGGGRRAGHQSGSSPARGRPAVHPWAPRDPRRHAPGRLERRARPRGRPPVVAETTTWRTTGPRPPRSSLCRRCRRPDRQARRRRLVSARARKGQRVTFEVWGNRLENKIHDLQTHLDPILSLHDQTGRELAAADNTRFADPLLSFQAPAAGTYYLQVRDTTYSGNPAWSYALEAVPGRSRPRRFPWRSIPARPRSSSCKARASTRRTRATLTIAKDQEPGVHLFAISRENGPALPVALVVTSLPVDRESKDAPRPAMPSGPSSSPRRSAAAWARAATATAIDSTPGRD